MQSFLKNDYNEALFESFCSDRSVTVDKILLLHKKDATNATIMNPKYSVKHTTVCAFSLNSRKFFNSTQCSLHELQRVAH